MVKVYSRTFTQEVEIQVIFTIPPLFGRSRLFYHRQLLMEKGVMYLKRWLSWKTDRTTGRKVYVLAMASSC